MRDEPGGKVPSVERLGRNPLSPEGEGLGLRQPQRQRSSFIDPESLFLGHKITENWVKKGQSLDELSLQFSISGQVLGLIFPLSLPSFFFFFLFLFLGYWGFVLTRYSGPRQRGNDCREVNASSPLETGSTALPA